ncbi:hypothetical protein CJ030_MR8G001762 [Morella rubra]|uniref:F-box domain-containing protein n=1 Tax=Morella rubra TaxID=262757 RepID=A0A6A1UT40_9ROSI|nr:hypothetical protein CJ030_MR8G001762 [Morella rubra]
MMLQEERPEKGMMRTKDLPEDLIVEILLRMRVKPLVRFRCVSKRWLSLISSGHFAKSHLKLASEQTQRLLLSTDLGLRTLDIDAPFGDGDAVRELDFPFKQTGFRVNILASCNGLVCMSVFDDKDFYIWNPLTGDHRRLPYPGFSTDCECIWSHGFGYDSLTDDYKLLLMADRPGVPIPECLVFSLKRNCWKRIQDPVNPDGLDESAGILSNGALHWSVEYLQLELKISAFDLAEEKFHEMPKPRKYDAESNKELYLDSLDNIGGRLCFVCRRRTHVELVVMMEYGVLESWATLFRVERFPAMPAYFMRPLCFSRSNELVAEYYCTEFHFKSSVSWSKQCGMGRALMRINPEGEISEGFMFYSKQFRCEPAVKWKLEPEAFVFVESSLSPNGYHADVGQTPSQ